MADLKITTKEQLKQAAAMNAAALGQLAQTVADALDEAYVEISNKYDGANIETGTGSLDVRTQSAIDGNLIKSAEYEYQKVGKLFTVFVTITFNACDFSYIQFTGLPGNANASSTLNRTLTATPQTGATVTVYPVGSWLTVRAAKTTAMIQDEQLKFPITFISK